MASAGMNVGVAKCFILFMAVLILLEGAAYLGLAIWGITLRTCKNQEQDISTNPLKFAMDLVYFASESCGDRVVTVNNASFVLTAKWAKSFAITHREYIFFITYAAVNGLWVVFSCLIISTLCSKTTKVISAACYWPWFLLIIAGSILDVVATVYHGIDIAKTTTLEDAFNYTGFSWDSDTPQAVLDQFKTYDSYFVTPAVIMTCISCRIVIIWLLNILGAAFCLSFARILSAQQSASVQSPAPQTVNSAPLPRPAATYQPAILVQETIEASAPPASPAQQYVLEYPEQIRPKPLPIIIPANNGNAQQADRTVLQSPVAILPPPAPQQDNRRLSPETNGPPNDTTYRTTNAHPDRLNYPPSSPSNSPEMRNHSPELEQLAVTSPLNMRYSESLQFSNQNNQRVSEELRGQLPWSYTSMVAKPPPPPRKPQVQIYPEIPEPDYGEDH